MNLHLTPFNIVLLAFSYQQRCSINLCGRIVLKADLLHKMEHNKQNWHPIHSSLHEMPILSFPQNSFDSYLYLRVEHFGVD